MANRQDHLNGVIFIDHIQDNSLYHEQTRQKINLYDVLKLTNMNK